MHDAPQRCLSRPTPAKTPDSLVALAWYWFTLWMGIDLVLTLRPLNLRGWDDRAVTPCRPKDSKNRLSEAFLRMAVELTARGVPTPNGAKWHGQTVRRIIDRAGC